MDPQQSRPPSVDSVNLGSTYSGFFPYAGSHLHHQQQQQHLMQQHHQQPQHHSLPHMGHYQQQQQQQQQQYQQQQQMYQNYAQQNSHGQMYPMAAQQPGQAGSTTGAASSGPESLNYQYSVSAAAAAAAAIHLRSQAGPGSAAMPQYSNPSMYSQQQQQAQQHYSQQWPNAGLASAATAAAAAGAGALPGMPYGNSQATSDYYSEYVSNYYREYYRRYLMAHQQRATQAQTKTPLKYGSRLIHARAAFSQNVNQLLVVESRTQIGMYGLRELFTERCYPSLFLQSLLLPDAEASGGEGAKILLPFNDVQIACEWLRIKSLNDQNYELKLVLKVLTMLFRQNGTVSGLDLSELLYETVSGGGGMTGTQLNDSIEHGSIVEKSSSHGESESRASRDQLLAHLRQLLMRGQKRVAITFAQNNGLYDHAMALVFLTTFQQQPPSSNNQMDYALLISTVRKFITSTLETTDPIYVFYSHLLQLVTSQVNAAGSSGSQPIPSTTIAKIESLEALIILLANDINFDKVEIADNSLKNLIDLMIALLKNDADYVLPDELFSESFDCLLVNECLEFARFGGRHLNQRLLLRKLEFAFELFDFGFIPQSIKYCEHILRRLKQSDFDLKKIVAADGAQFKASPLQYWLVPLAKLSPDSTDEENHELIVKLWSYQIFKMLSRYDPSQSAESDLILMPPEPEPSSEEESSNSEDATEDDDESEESEPEPEPVKPSKKKKSSAQKVSAKKSAPTPPPPAPEPVVEKKSRSKEPKVATLKMDGKKKAAKSQVVAKKGAIGKRSTAAAAAAAAMANNKQESQSDSRATSRATDHDESIVQDIREEPSFSTQLSSTVEHDQSIGRSIGSAVLGNDLTMSPIEPNKSRSSLSGVSSPPSVPQASSAATSQSQPLRESVIQRQNSFESRDSFSVSNDFSSPFGAPPPPQPSQQQPQQPQFGGGPFGARPLNPIVESGFEHQESFDSTPGPSAPQSPQKSSAPFEPYSGQPQSFAPSSGPFSMQGLEQSLPNGDGPLNSGTSHVDGPTPQQAAPMFAPPPMSFDTSAPPVFDFMSSGQVTSIPTFDSGPMNNDSSAMAANGNHAPASGQFEQQQPQKKDESKKDSSSPSKNNGGIFSSLLGKFKSSQIILPDDKNPSIVFDPVSQQWVDKDANGAPAGVPPPPPMLGAKPPPPSFGQPGPPQPQPQASSEPNSTLTSPVGAPNFPMSNSFSSPPSNGPQLGGGPAGPGAPQFQPPMGARGPGNKPGARKSRYIDVWNQPK